MFIHLKSDRLFPVRVFTLYSMVDDSSNVLESGPTRKKDYSAFRELSFFTGRGGGSLFVEGGGGGKNF